MELVGNNEHNNSTYPVTHNKRRMTQIFGKNRGKMVIYIIKIQQI